MGIDESPWWKYTFYLFVWHWKNNKQTKKQTNEHIASTSLPKQEFNIAELSSIWSEECFLRLHDFLAFGAIFLLLERVFVLFKSRDDFWILLTAVLHMWHVLLYVGQSKSMRWTFPLLKVGYVLDTILLLECSWKLMIIQEFLLKGNLSPERE